MLRWPYNPFTKRHFFDFFNRRSALNGSGVLSEGDQHNRILRAAGDLHLFFVYEGCGKHIQGAPSQSRFSSSTPPATETL